MEETTKNKFVTLAVEVIKSIDEFRSMSADLSKDTEDGASSKPTESRINTFYRMIGLPSLAVSRGKNIDKKAHGNLFISKEGFNELLSKITDRENAFNIILNDDIIKNFQNFNVKPINVAIESTNFKGSLSPLAIDGRVNILPQARRIAGAFFKKDEDIKEGKIKYTRPLLESIILMRTKGIGVIDQVQQQEVGDDFFKNVESLGLDLGELRAVEIAILRALTTMVLSDKGIAAFVSNTIKSIEKAVQEEKKTIKDSGSDKSPEEQKLEVPADQKAQLDKLKEKREMVSAENSLRLQLLEYDDSLSEEISKNMKNAALTSTLVGLITADSQESLDDITEEETKKERVQQEIRNSHKQLDLITGQYSGISGVDIFVVITALFSLPLDDLIGLLNDEAKTRLKEIRADVRTSSKTVVESIDALEKKIKEIYKSLKDKVEASDQFKNLAEGEQGSAADSKSGNT